ncbi:MULTISPECIES: hypothetical protein [unclassified Endozoicomonas]|uniref:hypothetical protein n=2 Tax=Endozoicomonas TaxID=305899 RepID=UPI002148DF32|nr:MULTISPECIES: hypothetical protein [unclassified Endozoicomonas]
MSLQHRAERLESHFESLDNAVHRLIEISGETQKIVLENQRENRLRIAQHDRELSEIKAAIGALTEATLAGFKRSDEKIEQLELLIRQRLPNN